MSKIVEQQVRELEDRMASVERWMRAQEDKRLEAAHEQNNQAQTLRLKRG